jgi:hypothetical protein
MNRLERRGREKYKEEIEGGKEGRRRGKKRRENGGRTRMRDW